MIFQWQSEEKSKVVRRTLIAVEIDCKNIWHCCFFYFIRLMMLLVMAKK